MRTPVKFIALALLTLPLSMTASISWAQVDISLNIGTPSYAPVEVAPPPIPVYMVPAPPMEGVMWMPGYWSWESDGYYWVPGTWVQPPVTGVLWTPGYWGWNNDHFGWHEGYWGPHLGFYGGVNYGGGYNGSGFSGGNWQHGNYVVNRSVTNVTNITNVTNTTNVSFNGGPGGNHAAPTPEQQSAANEKHIPPTGNQIKHMQMAKNNPQLRASANHGKPAIAATTRPGAFKGQGVVAAKQAGPRNPAAEQHNQAVAKKPAPAMGAVPSRPSPAENKRPSERQAPEANTSDKEHPNKINAPKPQEERPQAEHRPESAPKPRPEGEQKPEEGEHRNEPHEGE